MKKQEFNVTTAFIDSKVSYPVKRGGNRMEFWLTLLVALPATFVSILQVYDWYKERRKKSE